MPLGGLGRGGGSGVSALYNYTGQLDFTRGVYAVVCLPLSSSSFLTFKQILEVCF